MDRYGCLSEKIANEIQQYEATYFTYDEPVPFCGLQIYPISMRNYNDFMLVNPCLTLNKNETFEGLKQTHLDFLIGKLNDQEEGQLWTLRLSKLFELIFHLKDGVWCTQCGNTMTYAEFITQHREILTQEKPEEEKLVACPKCGSTQLEAMIRYVADPETKKYKLVVAGHSIDAAAFERLRQIVMYQNLPDYYDDSKIDPDLKADYAERIRIKSQKSGKATTEKKMVCVSAKTCYKLSELYDMPIRKFLMLLTTVDDVIQYEATRVGMMTGMVSMKEPPEHWIYKKETDVLGDAYKSLDSFKSEMSQI